MNETARRRWALLCFVLGLIAAGTGYWHKATAGAARSVELEAARVARVRNQQALDALVREIEPHAGAAANVQELINALDQEVDANTFQDLFATEEWWERIRKGFEFSAVVAGNEALAWVGPRGVPLASSPVVANARRRELASGLAIDDRAGTVYLLGAALVTRAKNTARQPVLVLAQRLDEKLLGELSARTGDALALAAGAKLLAFGGNAELRPGLAALAGQERGFEGALEGQAAPQLGPGSLVSAVSVAPGLWLWMAFAAPPATGWPALALVLFAVGLILTSASAALIFTRARPMPPAQVSSPGTPAPGGYGNTSAQSQATSHGHATVRPLAGEARRAPPRSDLGYATPNRSRSMAPTSMPVVSDDVTSEHRAAVAAGGHAAVALAPTTRRTQPYEMGRYRLLKLIGEGGMAEVYIASAHGAEGFERHFVVKRLHPHLAGRKEIVSQFIDEARLQARLLHSNIVSVFDFGRAGDEYFLALEYVHGRDLERVLQRHVQIFGRPLSLSVVFYVAHEILEALAYAHARGTSAGEPLGIVHRDVSPSNVLVSFLGEVKLSDFGIVKAEVRVSQTDVGVVKGNVSYMSPEQARGEAVDQRSDLFSLGMLIFYCLTGRSLYASETPVNQLMRAAVGPVAEQFEELAELPPMAQEVLRKALARDPADRYQSAIEFSRALVGFTSGARSEFGELMKELYPEEIKRDF